MKKRIWIGSLMALVWGSPGLAATKAKPAKGVDEATCFSCHEEVKELKKSGKHAGLACTVCHSQLDALLPIPRPSR